MNCTCWYFSFQDLVPILSLKWRFFSLKFYGISSQCANNIGGKKYFQFLVLIVNFRWWTSLLNESVHYTLSKGCMPFSWLLVGMYLFVVRVSLLLFPLNDGDMIFGWFCTILCGVLVFWNDKLFCFWFLMRGWCKLLLISRWNN